MKDYEIISGANAKHKEVSRQSGSLLPILRVGFLVAASIVGAGFASGKEILIFFTRFNSAGILGIIIAALFFTYSSYIVIKTANDRRLHTSEEFMAYFFGSLGKIFEYLTISFVFVVFSAMLTGSGLILQTFIGVKPYVCSLAILMASLTIMNKGILFLQKFSVISMQILFWGIVIFSVYVIVFRQGHHLITVWNTFWPDNSVITGGLFGTDGAGNYLPGTMGPCQSELNTEHQAYTSQYQYKPALIAILPIVAGEALFYIGFNSLLSLNSLIAITLVINKNKQIFYGIICGGLIFLITAVLMNSSMLGDTAAIEKEDFPFIAVLDTINSHLGSIYKVLVFLAMILSVVINGYFLFQKNKLIPPAAYLMVFTGFSVIVTIFYPAFGIIGLIFFIFLIIRYFMIE